jgi:hypothetical protein
MATLSNARPAQVLAARSVALRHAPNRLSDDVACRRAFGSREGRA